MNGIRSSTGDNRQLDYFLNGISFYETGEETTLILLKYLWNVRDSGLVSWILSETTIPHLLQITSPDLGSVIIGQTVKVSDVEFILSLSSFDSFINILFEECNLKNLRKYYTKIDLICLCHILPNKKVVNKRRMYITHKWGRCSNSDLLRKNL